MSKVLLSPATFAGGSLVGAFLLAAWLGAFTSEPEPDPAPPARAAAVAAPQKLAAPAQQKLADAAPTTVRKDVAVADPCPAQALSEPSGNADGRFDLNAALSTGAEVEPAAFVTVAREAAKEGRVRDAEVALLAACHVVQKAGGGPSVALADVKTQMAQEYVALAAVESDAREGLLKRAASLLSESAITYSAVLGREASKTRLAEQRLASLHDPATLRHARAETATRIMGAVPQSAEEASPPRSDRTGPAARLIAADPELAQLERDMQRLHAQASSVSRDRGGMRQRDAHALAQRDARCQDKACLLGWYAQRRKQLLAEF